MSLRHWAPTRKFFAQLAQCDQQIAVQMGVRGRCSCCGGRLHRADYPRKVLGCDGLHSGLTRRVSFCCARRECRKRMTPPSFRFADRKWYALFVVLVAAALGPAGSEHETGCVAVVGATPSLRTVRRWQSFFRCEFVMGSIWAWLRSRLTPQPPPRELPRSLVAWVGANGHDAPEATIGETINWLVQAGLAPLCTQIDGQITIRREWHC